MEAGFVTMTAFDVGVATIVWTDAGAATANGLVVRAMASMRCLCPTLKSSSVQAVPVNAAKGCGVTLSETIAVRGLMAQRPAGLLLRRLHPYQG